MKINILFVTVFFLAGAALAFFGDKGPISVKEIKEVKTDDRALVLISDSEYDDEVLVESFSPVTFYSSDKHTVTVDRPLSADRKNAQTGETVKFSSGLKNTGARKKFLTHICFSDSIEGNFGCIRNKNLQPGESFSFDGFMTYRQPGKHSVSLSWSQDHQNFYPPLGHVPVSVDIY